VDYEDIRAAIKPALRHRVLLNFEGEAHGLTPDAYLEELGQLILDVPEHLRAEAGK